MLTGENRKILDEKRMCEMTMFKVKSEFCHHLNEAGMKQKWVLGLVWENAAYFNRPLWNLEGGQLS